MDPSHAPCTAYTTRQDPHEAARELAEQLCPCELVIFFASPGYHQPAIAKAVHRALPPARTMGCTAAGQIIDGHMLENSVVAMGFRRGFFSQLQLVAASGISSNEGSAAVREALGKLPLTEAQPDTHTGLLLVDGLSMAEEMVMAELAESSPVEFIGGSASTTPPHSTTEVFLDGDAVPNGLVLALLAPSRPFRTIKTQSFHVLPATLTPTKVDPATRRVLEFDGLPAVEAYAETIGVSVVDAEAMFMRHPLGLMRDGEPWVRSPMRVEGTAMVFYANIREGTPLAVLESSNIIVHTRERLEEMQAELGEVSGLIVFNCILRARELANNNQTRAYGDIFATMPTVGFHTYGEAYQGHINQTATMLAFG